MHIQIAFSQMLRTRVCSIYIYILTIYRWCVAQNSEGLYTQSAAMGHYTCARLYGCRLNANKNPNTLVRRNAI